MKRRFQITHTYTSTKLWYVDAETVEQAIELVNGDKALPPDFESSAEFDSEWVEEVEC